MSAIERFHNFEVMLKGLNILWCVVLVFAAVFPCNAQWVGAEIGVDGLTCAACSYGVEQSIRKLPGVNEVNADLSKADARITFAPDATVLPEALAQKVMQAGYSVRYVSLVYHFVVPRKISGDTLHLNNQVICLLNARDTLLKGDVTFQFIASKLTAKKVLKRWEPQIQLARMRYPMMQPDTYFVVL